MCKDSHAPVAEGAHHLGALPAERLVRGGVLERQLRDPVAAHERRDIGEHVKGVGEHRERAGHDSKHKLAHKVREGQQQHNEKLAR